MTTFSQLVDRIAEEMTRPDMVDKLPGYLNQTIRELFVHARTNLPCFFDDARQEAEIEIDTLSDKTESYIWPLPFPARFQALESVFYDSASRYVRRADPRTALMHNDFDVSNGRYWYRIGGNIVFSNPGRIGQKIRVSWFEYPRALAYQKPADRDIVYDRAGDIYLVKAGTPDPLAAEAAATNWVLKKHEELMAEGLRAKAWKRADDNRQRVYYAQYEASRLAIQESETANMVAEFAR